MSVCFGNINPGEVRTELWLSTFEAYKAGVFTGLCVHVAGPYLDIARNVVTQQFYDDETLGDYLLFVDSDIRFTADDVKNLEAHAAPDRLVSGVYNNAFAEFAQCRPVASRWTYDDKLKQQTLKPIHPDILKDVDDDGLVKIDGCGAGFFMIPREVLKRMVEVFNYPMPWFVEQVIAKTEQWYGEDYMFCLRAKMLGVNTYLVPSVQVGHLKVVQL